MAAKRVRLAMVGLGSVGQGVLGVMIRKRDFIADVYGLDLVLVGAADTSGAALSSLGLDLLSILELKADGLGVAALAEGGRPGMSAQEMVRELEADVLLDVSPVNLDHGRPGLDCVRAALGRGIGVVLANKAPLVLAYDELHALAAENGTGLAFSATVCGALPVVNIGQRDLRACEIDRVEGIFNSTTNYILTAMEGGASFAEGLKEAQKAGIAEADPSLDVEGWDTANKLVIVANSVMGYSATLEDVQVQGVEDVTADDLAAAQGNGGTIKLVATAEKQGGGYQLRVEPTGLGGDHPLARVTGWQMGIVYHTDIMGEQFASVDERGPQGTSAAMLRDVINMAVA